MRQVNHIDLVVPGLFDLPLQELSESVLRTDLPMLNRLLGYANRVENRLFDLESILAQCLNLVERSRLPFALAFTGSKTAPNCLVLKAVHLKADMLDAVLLPLENSHQCRQHINSIIEDLNEQFKDQFYIEPSEHEFWVMHLKDCVAPEHYPHYLSVIGHKAGPYIEQSRQWLPWYRLMNEIQMFMHLHQVNQGRIELGLLTVNSLWCWGAGVRPEAARKDLTWFCDDTLLGRFADIMGYTRHGLGAVESAQFKQAAVIIDLSVLEALRSFEPFSVPGVLAQLETRLFKPLVKAVASSPIHVRLRAGSETDFYINPLCLLKFWRRPKSLKDV